MAKTKKEKIEARENGPYVISNVKNLKTSRGEQAKTAKTMVLCRCGQSGSKPHCDGTHTKIGFTDEKKAERLPDKKDIYAGKTSL